jgi:hypothetical protein
MSFQMNQYYGYFVDSFFSSNHSPHMRPSTDDHLNITEREEKNTKKHFLFLSRNRTEEKESLKVVYDSLERMA